MKKLGIALVLALLLAFVASPIALADDPTEVGVSWDGSGFVDTDIDTGDAHAGFMTYGDEVSGTYTATDSNNNPYNYGVDSFVSKFVGYIAGEEAFMGTGCERLTSKVSMYGNPDQFSISSVYIEEGEADMAYRTTTNYAQMRDCCYGHQLPGGHNIVLDASYYEIDRYIEDGRGNSGEFWAEGTGTATLDCMNAEASGCWSLKLGRGCGCYTDANFNATGAGYVEVTGEGNNSVTFNGMNVSSGGGTLQFIANWVNSISIGDYSLTAN